MNAKEKAKDLVNWYYENLPQWVNTDEAKMCATKCVDEILKQFVGLNKPEYVAFDCIGERQFTYEGEYEDRMTGYDMVDYWNEVLEEIELIKYGDK
jgi:hypothetical protein